MTEAYKRLPEGYHYEVTEWDARGTEVYVRHDDAAGGVPFASLPVPGVTAMLTPTGSVNSLCVCKTATFEYADGDVNSGKWTFRFETPPGGGATVKADTEDRHLTLQGDVVVVDPGPEGSKWVWKEVYAGAEPCSQPISKFVVTGNFTIPKVGMTTAQFQTWWSSVRDVAGKINHAAFDPGTGNVFAPGQVLFTGVRGGTYSPPTGGGKRWKFDLSFDFKIINDTDIEGLPITSMDWNYVFAAGSSVVDPIGIGTYAGWAQPYHATERRFLYATADLTRVL